MSGLDHSVLRQMLAESVRAGVVATRAERLLLDRARVLAEHGVTDEEDARAFDRIVVALGGSLRRARRHRRDRLYWELPRTALDTGPAADRHSDTNAANG